MSSSQLVTDAPKRKAIVYIDGFNLYFAIKEKKWQGMLWLDVVLLAKTLLRSDQDLVVVKYFTSRIRNNSAKQKRQSAYLDALKTHCGDMIEIIEGYYFADPYRCDCGRVNNIEGEKQTDVNIATHMITDARKGSVDDVILITADSDQVPAMKAVREMNKSVLIVLPPGREKYLEIQFAANKKLDLNASKLKVSLLPRRVTAGNGFVFECPDKYRFW